MELLLDSSSVGASNLTRMLLNDHKLHRQGQGVSPVGSTTGSFTTFGTSLQRNQAFTTFGQQQQRKQQAGGQTNQAFTIFGQNNGGQTLASSSSQPTASFTSFGSSQPSRGNQGASFTTFGVVGSPPASPLGSIFGRQQSTLGGLQPSSLRSSFAGQLPVAQGLAVAQNQVGSSPNSFINFG